MFELIYSVGQSTQMIGKGLGWMIDSVLDCDINNSKYKLWSGISHIKLPKELEYPKKGLTLKFWW